MNIARLYVNFADRDVAGRVRIHGVFQPMGVLPEASLAPGQPVLLDDERGHTVPASLIFDEWSETWLAQAQDDPGVTRL
jgi:hypothetical protein